MMKEYHKIETLFERDMSGSKRLMPGVWRNETVEFLQDVPWIWTEKVDGTNIRIHWDGHAVSFGGRTERAQIPADLMNYLVNTFGGEANAQLFEQTFGEKELTLFGEGYGPKIQKGGGLYRNDVSFILFDVLTGDTWLTRYNVQNIANCFGVDVVPIVGVGSLLEAVDYVKTKPRSTINAAAPMEGIVARPGVELKDRRGHRVVVKIKACDFSEEE